MDFGRHDRDIARPVDWTFTRSDHSRVVDKITQRASPLRARGLNSAPLPDVATG